MYPIWNEIDLLKKEKKSIRSEPAPILFYLHNSKTEFLWPEEIANNFSLSLVRRSREKKNSIVAQHYLVTSRNNNNRKKKKTVVVNVINATIFINRPRLAEKLYDGRTAGRYAVHGCNHHRCTRALLTRLFIYYFFFALFYRKNLGWFKRIMRV